MSLAVTVYTKPSCQQCEATKRRFKNDGIEFEIGDATEEDNLLALKALGFRQAPVTIATHDGEEFMWSGFNPGMHDMLRARLV